MPEFILKYGSEDAADKFDALDEFTRGYIEAMFWLAKDWNDKDENDNPNEHPDWSVSDLAPETWTTILETCKEFQESFAEDLQTAYDQDMISYGMYSAGIDFWLTRNGHGAGLWDRGLGEVGETLAANARPYGETDLYMGDDGKLYLS